MNLLKYFVLVVYAYQISELVIRLSVCGILEQT